MKRNSRDLDPEPMGRPWAERGTVRAGASRDPIRAAPDNAGRGRSRAGAPNAGWGSGRVAEWGRGPERLRPIGGCATLT